jgi:hypothetical protein
MGIAKGVTAIVHARRQIGAILSDPPKVGPARVRAERLPGKPVLISGRNASQLVCRDGRMDRLPVIGSGFSSFRVARSAHYRKCSTG